MPDVSRYAEHSAFSDPGDLGSWVATLPTDLPALHYAASQLVFHYGHRDQFAEHGIAEGRLREIDTRYADEMFRLVRDLSDTPLGTELHPAQRMIGCCRDYTLFLVGMARQHGIPARSRVGFATYFSPGWLIDHVVAEIWDASERRWRLVDANLDPDHVDPTDGQTLDVLDLPRDRFLVAPKAWRRCRSGAADPERFIVNPALEEPFLRGWPYLLHNLLTDLAALDRRELVLWDVWGIGDPEGSPRDEDLVRLDALAADLAVDHPDGATISRWLALDDLRIPNPITSWSPATPGVSRQVTLCS
jgi:hypothetical protein